MFCLLFLSASFSNTSVVFSAGLYSSSKRISISGEYYCISLASHRSVCVSSADVEKYSSVDNSAFSVRHTRKNLDQTQVY